MGFEWRDCIPGSLYTKGVVEWSFPFLAFGIGWWLWFAWGMSDTMKDLCDHDREGCL